MSIQENQNHENWFKQYVLIGKVISKPSCDVVTKLLLLIGIIIPAALIIDYSRKISYDSETAENISKEFVDNFKTGYFLDFFKCNPHDEKIILDKWQGTVSGCGRNKTKDAYVPEEGKNCKENEIILKKIVAQDLSFFKGLSICATKNEYQYFGLLFSDSVVEENEKCPEETKNCGYIDTVKNKLCLKNDMSCPISFIEIKDKNSPPPEYKNLKNITGEKTILFYSNDPYADSSEIPYIKNSFKIAEDEICAAPHLYHSNIDLFVLDANKEKSNCILKDYSQKYIIDTIRYNKLNSINQYELYEENGIIDKIKAHNLNDYGFDVGKYKDNKLNLYVRTHIGFNKKCLQKRKTILNLEELEGISSTAKKMNKASNWFFGVNIGILTLIIPELLSFESTKNLEQIFCNLLQGGFSFYEFYDSIFYVLTYDDAYEQDMNCSDFVSNSNFNVMIEKIQNNGKILYKCAWFLGIEFFCILFLLILNIIEACNKEGNCGCCSEVGGCCGSCCKDCWEWFFKKTICCKDININIIIDDKKKPLSRTSELENRTNEEEEEEKKKEEEEKTKKEASN